MFINSFVLTGLYFQLLNIKSILNILSYCLNEDGSCKLILVYIKN